MKNPDSRPNGHTAPRLADRLLAWFVAPHLLESILGDLHEEYHWQVERLGRRRANWRYFREVLGFVRPSAIRRLPQANEPTAPFFNADQLQNTLKIAWRNLRAQRSYTLLNITGLTIGLTGGLLIFLFLEHHLSTDRYHTHANRIVRITTDVHLDDGSIERNPEAPQPLAEVLRRDYPQVEQAAFLLGVREMTIRVGNDAGVEPRRFREHKGVGFVEPQWFNVLTYSPLQGDPITALRQPNRAVLTESWAKRFFGNANPMGQRLLLDNRTPVTVAAVVAEPPGPTDTYLGLFISMPTLKQHDPTLDKKEWWQLVSLNRLYVRLRQAKDTATITHAFPALVRKHYGSMAHMIQFQVQPLRDVHFDTAKINYNPSIRSSLLWSLGLIGLLLVVAACINFVNLATAQALRRSKEVGIRKSLGSSRAQLAGQFLLETGLVVAAAAVLAGLLTVALLPTFRNWTQLPLSLHLDGPTLAFVGTLLVGVVLLAGTYPAVVLSGFNPVSALRGTLAGRLVGGFALRRVLVVVQFAVCNTLLIGALVVARQVHYLQQADLGFRKDNVVMVGLPDKKKTSQEAFRQRLLQYPGIESVSIQHRSPANALNYGGQFKFNGKADWEPYPIRERLADANYLTTYGLHLVAGRNLMPSDSIREYVINETLAHKLGFRDPKQVLGKPMQYYLSPVSLPIVGVVRDFHQKSLRDQIEPCVITTFPAMYAQAGIRVSGVNPTQTMAHIRKVWQSLYPNEVFEHEWLHEQVARFYETETLVGRLVNAFTTVALLICCLGLYGLMAQSVGQRTKEIGIRKVLGASVAGIVALLSRDFVKLVLAGIVLASPLAWWAMDGWLQSFAYRVNIGWWMFVLAGGLCLLIAFLTVSYQSIRAAMLDPVKTLRSE